MPGIKIIYNKILLSNLTAHNYSFRLLHNYYEKGILKKADKFYHNQIMKCPTNIYFVQSKR